MFYRPMLAVSVLAAAFVTGCNNPASKLIGKWEADMSAVMADVQSQVEKSGNPLAGALAGMMSVVKIEAEFKADGTCTIGGSVLGNSNSAAGKWRYLRSEGDDLVLMIKPDQSGEEKEVRVRIIDNDRFEMMADGETGGIQKLPFKRVVAK